MSDPGSLGEEAARLLEAVAEWSGRTFGADSSFGVASREHLATGSPACDWCPLCRLVSVLRGERPEVSQRLGVAANAIVDAVRSLLADADPPADPAGTRPEPVRVQPIDLDGMG